jgi:hypothetical protein
MKNTTCKNCGSPIVRIDDRWRHNKAPEYQDKCPDKPYFAVPVRKRATTKGICSHDELKWGRKKEIIGGREIIVCGRCREEM